ncbi:MAG TPA: DUF1990 domain-containing protein [Iamia sp.]|jgi:uncharacterized protein (UPF0548 family)|nr:DUF1990 domain-containing protein [Iamia sp.]
MTRARRVPVVRAGRLGAATAERILDRARSAAPTYDFVGDLLTDDPPDPDLAVERELGRGQDVFDRAVACFRSLGAARAAGTVWPDDVTAELGATVLVAAPIGPLTVVAINRIVGVVDEPDRWGFAYGTLPGHIEIGEEAFVVTRRADGTVVARITARSRAVLPGARLLQPLLLPVQRRFAERYLDAVVAAVDAVGA